jgi:hypothetical protein
MKPIPERFTQDGFYLRQLDRDGPVALYLKTKGERNRSYEVVIVKQEPENVMFGRLVPAHERYPGNEQWGQYGFTLTSEATAREKFAMLVNLYRTKQNAPGGRM